MTDTPDRILVIDDQPAIQRTYIRILSPGNIAHVGFEVDTASDADEARRRTEEAITAGRRYAVAFVDHNLGAGPDGLSLLPELWTADPYLETVFCTGMATGLVTELSQIQQCDRLLILKKPFEPIEVWSMAKALCEKRRLKLAERGRIDSLHRDLERRSAALRRAYETLKEEHRTALEAEQRHQRFFAITEASTDFVGITAPDGRPVYVNPAGRRMIGLGGAESLLDSIAGYLPADVGEHLLQDILPLTAARGSWHGRLSLKHTAGHTVPIDAQLLASHGPAGELVFFCCIASDLTERERLQAELLQAQKLESIGQLAAGIAHEINTPMQYIGDNAHFLQFAFERLVDGLRSQGELLEAPDLPPHVAQRYRELSKRLKLDAICDKVPGAIDRTAEGVEAVSRIVRAMKQFSHPGSEEKVSHDLNRAIQTTLTVSTNAWKYVADVETELDPRLPSVPCLPGAINQVLLNCVVNAAQAIERVVGNTGLEKGRIRITSALVAGHAEVRIGDTGGGIPAEIRGRVFDPFFTTKEVGCGTGQGLAIARSLVVDKHQGELLFETEPGRGTTFVIRLPLAEEATPA